MQTQEIRLTVKSQAVVAILFCLSFVVVIMPATSA